jgi:hypothetical protein
MPEGMEARTAACGQIKVCCLKGRSKRGLSCAPIPARTVGVAIRTTLTARQMALEANAIRRAQRVRWDLLPSGAGVAPRGCSDARSTYTATCPSCWTTATSAGST